MGKGRDAPSNVLEICTNKFFLAEKCGKIKIYWFEPWCVLGLGLGLEYSLS